IRYGGIQLEKKMRAIGAPMPEIDVHCPEIDGTWPPLGGGLLPGDLRQRLTMGFVRTVSRALPTVAPGLSMMMLHLAFAPDRTRDLVAVYRFDLSGPGGGVFTVTLRDGTCDISVGEDLEPVDVVYEMEASTWLAMSQGRVTGDEALLLGRLRVRGNSQLARRFADFFAPPGAPALQQDGDLPSEPGSGPARLLQRALRRRPAA
ncbi:MAG: SCP2 sterol-binding domain-containing protein, partial [Actinomycetota bacterium]|nr:SCP2 sterol-binding domain-containing protein [Actinomycetota bacterium]